MEVLKMNEKKSQKIVRRFRLNNNHVTTKTNYYISESNESLLTNFQKEYTKYNIYTYMIRKVTMIYNF